MPLLTVGSVIDRAWEHYTKHFLELMAITSWLLILAILNIISSFLSPDVSLLTPGAGPLSTSQTAGLVVHGLTFLIFAPILSLWISNRLIKGVATQLDGQSSNFKTLNAFGWKMFFPRLLVGILTALTMLSPLILLAPGGALSALAVASNSGGLSLAATALIFFGSVAAIAAIIYLAVRVVFAPYALLLDNQHGRRALRSSARLSRTRWWSVLFRVAVPAIVFYFGMTTAQIFLLFILKTIILQVAGLNAGLASQLYNIGSGTVFIILNMLVAPLVVCANTLVYKNLSNDR